MLTSKLWTRTYHQLLLQTLTFSGKVYTFKQKEGMINFSEEEEVFTRLNLTIKRFFNERQSREKLLNKEVIKINLAPKSTILTTWSFMKRQSLHNKTACNFKHQRIKLPDYSKFSWLLFHLYFTSGHPLFKGDQTSVKTKQPL